MNCVVIGCGIEALIFDQEVVVLRRCPWIYKVDDVGVFTFTCLLAKRFSSLIQYFTNFT